LTPWLLEVLLYSILQEIISEQLIIFHPEGDPNSSTTTTTTTTTTTALTKRLVQDVQDVGPDLLLRPYLPHPPQ
jgi:hypothetical protein